MKKIKLLAVLLVFAVVSINADEISLDSINCLDNGLGNMHLELSYNSDDGSLILYDKRDISIAYIVSGEARSVLLKAIIKAEEWKDVAVKNNVDKMLKDIPDVEDTKIIAYVNYGDGWNTYGCMINYQFLIMEHNNKIRYLFLIHSRSMDDINNGYFGMAYSFDIGKNSNALKAVFAEEMMARYKDLAEKESSKADLFE